MKRILCIMFVALLVTSVAHAASIYTIAGQRLADTQNSDGGWNWATSGPSNYNALAQSGLGLLTAYQQSGHFESNVLLAGSNLGTKSTFSVLDGYFAAAMDKQFGGSTYSNTSGLKSYYSSFNFSTIIDNAAYTVGNKLWSLGMGLASSVALGLDTSVIASWSDAITTVSSGLHEDGSDPDAFLGIAGASWGTALSGGDTTGLGDWIAWYQNADGGFGLYLNQSTAQETAWAILALKALGYDESVINSGENFLYATQLGTGGWGDSLGTEYNITTGDVLTALGTASSPVPEPTTLFLLGSGLVGMVWYRRRSA